MPESVDRISRTPRVCLSTCPDVRHQGLEMAMALAGPGARAALHAADLEKLGSHAVL